MDGKHISLVKKKKKKFGINLLFIKECIPNLPKIDIKLLYIRSITKNFSGFVLRCHSIQEEDNTLRKI